MINKLNSKDSLSHWDVATEFTGEQVTALALGKDPVHATEISIKGMPLYQRLERSYNAARRWHALDADAEPNWDQIGVASEKELLHSIGVVQAMTHFDPDDAENRSRWLASDEHCGFSSQRFAREEVARWLSACGIHSAYKFADSKFTESELLPQSVRNTLLKMIIGMAIRGYIFDPKASKSKVPKEIEEDISLLGMSVTDETILKYLKEAAETVLPKIPDNS